MTISLRDKICRRAGHVCFLFNDQLYIWGGLVEHITKKPRYPNTIPTNCNDLHDTAELFAYDPIGEQWRGLRTTGDIPPRNYGAAGCVVQNSLYVFGGHHCYESDPGYIEDNNNLLFELQLIDLRWRRVRTTEGQSPPKVEKSLLFNHGRGLYLFGGYGEMKPSDEDFEENIFSQSKGWNCKLTRFCLDTKRWQELKPKGPKPSPRAGHAGVVLSDQLILFGGRGVHNRLNDLHILDLQTLTWLKTIIAIGVEMPEARSLHTLTAVDENRAVLYGGLGASCQPLNDAWMFDLRELSWKELELRYDHGEVRCWHGAVCTRDGQLLVHSGLTQEYYLNRVQLDGHPTVATLALMQFGPKSLLRAALDKCLSLKGNDVATIPKSLLQMLKNRWEDQEYDYDTVDPPNGRDHFDRDMIHEGS